MVEMTMYNKTMDFYSTIVDCVDDVVVALLKALQKRSDKNSEKVIQDFLKYVENGGKLKSIEISKDALNVLANELKDKDISFLSTTDAEDDKLTIVHFKDRDIEKVQDILTDLTNQGVKLQYTNRVELSNFAKERGSHIAQAAFTREEFKKYRKEINHTLNRELNIPYTIHMSSDQKIVLVSVPSEYADAVKETPAFNGKVRRLDEKLTLNDIKAEVEKHKAMMNAEKAEEKAKSNGR